jgi:predicted RND superfamily exporter protein
MNDDLKREIITPETKQNKRRAYSKKHMEKCKTMCVTLRQAEDADIIAWLDKQDNKSESVRKAIRGYLSIVRAFEKAQKAEIRARAEEVSNG